jgi:hypothetical protein
VQGNDLKFGIQLQQDELYRDGLCDFGYGHTSTSCWPDFWLWILVLCTHKFSLAKTWEPSMENIWNLVCSFSMMSCTVCAAFVTVAHQLLFWRGHTCPMDLFLLVSVYSNLWLLLPLPELLTLMESGSSPTFQ